MRSRGAHPVRKEGGSEQIKNPTQSFELDFSNRVLTVFQAKFKRLQNFG
jgi:hypothetical protein